MPALPSTRLFIVGCARSGTTILQSCIGAHPRIFTFPESRLMRTTRGRRPWAKRLGIASRMAHPLMSEIYTELGLDPADCRPHFFQQGYMRDFIQAVDRACVAAGKDVWLEKTPDHLYDIDTLQHFLPDAKFIHILREGTANVSSLVDVTRKYPEWSNGPESLEDCLARWLKDAELSLRRVGQPNHWVLRHADLVAMPEAVIRAVDRFAGLEFDPAQLSGLSLDRIASSSESWKAGVRAGVSRPDTHKYRDLLSPKEWEMLQAAVAPMQARIDALPALSMSCE